MTTEPHHADDGQNSEEPLLHINLLRQPRKVGSRAPNIPREDEVYGRSNPEKKWTFLDIEDILPDPTQSGVYGFEGYASFRIAFYPAPAEHVENMIKAPPPGRYTRRQDVDPSTWFNSRVTFPDGYRWRNTLATTAPLASPFKVRYEGFMKQGLHEVVASVLAAYYSSIKDLPFQTVRVPVEVRVRDIVHHRFFRQAFAAVANGNLPCVSVRADNVLGYDRPEASDERVLAFCGQCFKIGCGHGRCGGCKVCHKARY